MSELDATIRDIATMFTTGTAPGEPTAPFAWQFDASCTVSRVGQFAVSVRLPNSMQEITNLHFLKSYIPTIGDKVLILKGPKMWLILGAIS